MNVVAFKYYAMMLIDNYIYSNRKLTNGDRRISKKQQRLLETAETENSCLEKFHSREEKTTMNS